MNRSLLKPYVLLAAPFLLATAPAFADNHSVDFYGSLGAGFLQHSEGKADLTDAERAACSLNDSELGCGPAKAMSYSTIGNHYYFNHLGLNYKASESVSGKVEFDFNLNNNVQVNKQFNLEARGTKYLRQYYLNVDLGAGSLRAGRQERPFALVAKAADRLVFASGLAGVAGDLAAHHGNAVTYNTGKLLGPAMVHVGLVEQDNIGAKDAGGNPAPAVEAAVHVAMDKYSVGLGLLSTSKSMPKDPTNMAAGVDSVSLSSVSVNASANVSIVNATLVYTMGDPITKSATKLAKVTKDEKDKLSGLNLWVSANTNGITGAFFYGMETATLNKKLGYVNWKGESKDVTEKATTMGIHVGYDYKDAHWMLEYVSTARDYDGKVINNNQYIGLGVRTEWHS